MKVGDLVISNGLICTVKSIDTDLVHMTPSLTFRKKIEVEIQDLEIRIQELKHKISGSGVFVSKRTIAVCIPPDCKSIDIGRTGIRGSMWDISNYQNSGMYCELSEEQMAKLLDFANNLIKEV